MARIIIFGILVCAALGMISGNMIFMYGGGIGIVILSFIKFFSSSSNNDKK